MREMAGTPTNPEIYHITHLDNLAQIVAAGALLSDAERLSRNLDCRIVGMSNIKLARLVAVEVPCHPGTKVGEYVPFYFCPRSVMLYLLHMGNHPELDYHGGQRPILHLVANVRDVVAWADAQGRRWAFSDCNARAGYAHFFNNLEDLKEINWPAVAATSWRDPPVKEGKQAEFLVYESFPWQRVEHIGVEDQGIERRVNDILRDARHKPLVTVEPNWYY